MLLFLFWFCNWKSLKLFNFANYCVRKKVSLLYFAYLLTINDNYIMYGFCDIKRYRQICNFGSFFAVLTPWNTTKPKFWKKAPEDIIILYINTINGDHMMYVSWDMEGKGQNSFLLWASFCPFTPAFPPHPSHLPN